MLVSNVLVLLKSNYKLFLKPYVSTYYLLRTSQVSDHNFLDIYLLIPYFMCIHEIINVWRLNCNVWRLHQWFEFVVIYDSFYRDFTFGYSFSNGESLSSPLCYV